MSNLDRQPAVWGPVAPGLGTVGGRTRVPATPVRDVVPGRVAHLGPGTQVRRLLPTLGRRLVGAWCFLDHYGPDDIAAGPGMQVPPHPHIGLQTVSWLLSGTVTHRDSLGSHQEIRPGELGLMTAGAGIAHAEQSPVPHPALLHGVQLWVALPSAARATAAAWQHVPQLPVMTERGLRAIVFMGSLAGALSPARTYSPLVGADLTLDARTATRLPLEPDFEHAAIALSGTPEIDGVTLTPGALLYLGAGRNDLTLRSDVPSRLLLLGGEPFEERIVMWWNFVARSGEEVAAARADWAAGRFGPVPGYVGDVQDAPPLPPTPLVPRRRDR